MNVAVGDSHRNAQFQYWRMQLLNIQNAERVGTWLPVTAVDADGGVAVSTFWFLVQSRSCMNSD